ncbi:MAG: HAD hydrolase-like protein [Lachnospiraceae bacterium]|nr:HAD hydrolase-like protein [Lachnospiraceae bacterium]
MRDIEHIMFDFDGTLADTSEGIIRSMHYAFDRLHVKREQDEVIRDIIGPPLEEMFAILLHTKDEAYIKRAVIYFRERYAKEGVRELCLYPGARETLSALRDRGLQLYIVTSKPQCFVQEICREHGIDVYFSGVTGVSTEGKSPSKAERMVILMKDYGITAENGIMVGDRPEDAKAAAKNGVRCVGVAYGFGRREELEQAGCTYVIDELRGLLQLTGAE